MWLLVVKGTYKSVEKVFLAASFFYFAYIIAGVLAGPSWKEAFVATFKPPHGGAFRDSSYIYMVIAVVGTTIAPWMQFYLQSSIVEKGITPREYRASRWDVILGCLFTDVVAWFIVVACAATLYVHGIRQIRDGADAAQALRPLAGEYAYILFAAGLFNASLFAASILPISTAYTVCEGLGFESGVGHKFGEAKVFYWLYTLLLIAGGGVILLPNLPLVKISVLSQVVNGIVLPFVLIFMLLLINKSELMGKYVNGTWFNLIAWATTIIMIGLTIAWFATGRGRELESFVVESFLRRKPKKSGTLATLVMTKITGLVRRAHSTSVNSMADAKPLPRLAKAACLLGNFLHQGSIGVEEVEHGQVTPIDPANLAENAILQLSLILFHDEKV